MNLRPLFKSIITRLLLLGLGMVLTGAVVHYYKVTRFLREDLSTVVEGQQLALATYVARDIDYKIVQRQHLLEGLAASLPRHLLSQPEQLRAWLKERHEYQPLFSLGLMVITPLGATLADYPALPQRAHASFAGRDDIEAALTGFFYIGRPLVDHVTHQPVLPMAAPLKDRQGEVQAVLVGVTALAAPGFLDALLQSRIGTSSGGFLLISPRDKLFVAASQPEMVLRPTPPAGVNVLHDRAMAGFRGTGLTVNAQGGEEISAMVSVPSTGWFVVARLPTLEAFATVGRTQQFLINNTAIAILIFLILLLLGLYWVFHPLFKAAEQANRMTLGELPLERLPVVRQDEVGHLISAFNRLLFKLNAKQAELEQMAHHDALTGLPNRALLADRLGQALAQAKRHHTQMALLFMDLDGFKPINDALGHEAGDLVLQQVAARLGQNTRQTDTLARVGGDEFVLVLCHLENSQMAAVTIATKCIEALKEPFKVAGTSCQLGVSIGIALGNGDSTPDALLLAADQAMYQAKKAGRNRYITAPT
ncbi:GGDEF domain-containing protein [Rhodoferax sp.]|uniref:GGDEF domain-containing protein n=1 Tax=Rhodoferax sp. TaxID=50421 RepID=UPI00262612F8|nr:GGDEF domain-containing protein [Rhodoferax sp.]MDD2923961.1 GGDEF domain-containing protein [Rhodoferax sp.]